MKIGRLSEKYTHFTRGSLFLLSSPILLKVTGRKEGMVSSTQKSNSRESEGNPRMIVKGKPQNSSSARDRNRPVCLFVCLLFWLLWVLVVACGLFVGSAQASLVAACRLQSTRALLWCAGETDQFRLEWENRGFQAYFQQCH